MLHGDKIRLRALERSDIPTFVRWFNDPDIRRMLLITDPMSRAGEERWFEAQLESKDKVFGIEVDAGDGGRRLIGNIGLVRINWKDRVASIGIVIGEKELWGQGYGQDAIATMEQFAFDELNLHRLELEVFEFNSKARRCYEARGFKLEGTRREALFRDGRYNDVHQMGLLASERVED